MIQCAGNAAPSFQKKRSFENRNLQFSPPSCVIIYCCRFPGNPAFFPKLQCANSHKRTLPCLKARNSCLESMCCREFLKQSHTLATKLLLGRATCQSWQFLLLKGRCVSNWVSPPPTVFPCLWYLTAMARIQEPSRGAPVRVGRLQVAWSNEDDSGELYLPRDSSPRCGWVSAWKPKG